YRDYLNRKFHSVSISGTGSTLLSVRHNPQGIMAAEIKTNGAKMVFRYLKRLHSRSELIGSLLIKPDTAS
ncbi:MAG: hypothetical protein ACREUM_00505, partial [Nitrosospira sp.]